MRTCAAAMLFACVTRAATLTPFTPILPFTFEQNSGQLRHPATHIAADHGWAFDCGSLYKRPPDRANSNAIPSITLDNSNPACQSSMAFAAPAIAHYYRGSDRTQWIESVQRFNILAYKSVANGLDWQYQARGNVLEWRWDVAAGIDPASFTLRFENEAYAYAFDQGLSLQQFGVIPHPVAIQLKRTLPARWHFDAESKTASIVVDNLDPMVPMSITISLPLSPLNLTNMNATRDPTGNWLVLASSDSLASLDARTATCTISRWPYACPSLIAARFAPDGTLLSETNLSGSRYQSPFAIRSEPGGNFYVTGATYSTDFPVTEDAAQREYAGPAEMQLYWHTYPGGDAFIAKLYGPNGALIHSTLAGGPLSDWPISFDVDNDGRPALLLHTQDGPSPAPYETTRALRLNEPFTHFDFSIETAYAQSIRAGLDGSSWLLSNPSGGSNNRSYLDHIGPAGDLLESLSLPDGFGAAAFAVAPGPTLWFSAVQSQGESFIPVLARYAKDAFDIRPGWPSGSIETDAAGNVSLLAQTGFATQPVLPPVTPDALLLEPCDIGNYYARFTPDFALEHATFLPPLLNLTSSLSPSGLPVMSAGSSFYLLNPAAPPQPFLACTVHSNVPGSFPFAPASLITLRGRDIGPAIAQDWQLDETGKVATSLGGVRLTFAGLPAPLLRVEPHRIDAIIPYAAPAQTGIPMQLTLNGQVIGSQTISSITRSFAVFRIENEDGTINSADNPAKLGSTIRLLGSGAGPTDPPGVDGQVGHPVLAIPQVRLRARYGAAWLEPLRFNQAPEWPSGVMEAVLQLPSEPPPFASPVYLSLDLGGSSSRQSPTIYFK